MKRNHIQEVRQVDAIRELIREARHHEKAIGLVPTMGFLHRGHESLISAADAENDLVIVSSYVNPSQFGPSEDFERYPRDPVRDREIATQAGADVLFEPSNDDMYPDEIQGQSIWIDVGDLARTLCGASRPGHFRGVATVVAKLFNIVQPDRAYFGQKDAQQAIIVTRMVRDLAMPVEVRTVATVREPDGLALSSRNVYLSPEERRQAPALNASLALAGARFKNGERDPDQLRQTVGRYVTEQAPLGRLDYVDVVDLKALSPIHGTITSAVLAAAAVYFGSTRLIDNTVLDATESESLGHFTRSM